MSTTVPPGQSPAEPVPDVPAHTTWPGLPFPQGASYDGRGTNFSLYSEGAEAVELCLTEPDGSESCIEMATVSAFCHHVYRPGLEPGRQYGFRVHGPWDPAR